MTDKAECYIGIRNSCIGKTGDMLMLMNCYMEVINFYSLHSLYHGLKQYGCFTWILQI
jgi:hypothetical protein